MTVRIHTLEEKIASLDATQSALSTQEYCVNMGPQHPSTHGVLRLVLKMDGETVKDIVPVLGYVHRGIEKMGENLTYRQFIHLSDRLDYLSALMNNWAVSKTVEKAAGIETNFRIETIRTILSELQRVQSHLLWWGVFGMDLGAFTPFMHGFRDREIATDIIEETTGGRLNVTYIQPGGLMYDIPASFQKNVKNYISYLRPKLNEYRTLFTDNVITQERLRNVGVLSSQTAISFGATGPVLRGSGIKHDLRLSEPYGVYDQVKFKVPTGTVGDCWDRYWIRLEEINQSLSILEQLIDNIPEGKHLTVKPAAKIVLPEGIYYSRTETPRGILGVFIVSDGKNKPYRIHLRTPGFNNLWTITAMAPGGRMADLVSMISSIDIIVPDVDR